jgi:hypothetical protein
MKHIPFNIPGLKTKIFFALLISTFFIAGCSDKKGCTNSIAINFDSEAEKDDGSCMLAGSGGNTTIVAFPQHHGEPIINHANYRDTAYVKFNTVEFPGTNPSLYDLTFVGDHVGEEHVHLESLKPGKYYIYMVGLDTTISQRVTGGIPYTLTQSSGEVDLDVPVTE